MCFSESMPVADFIRRTGRPYEMSFGLSKKLGREVSGYTGNYSYFLPLSGFGAKASARAGMNSLAVVLECNGTVMMRSDREFIY